MSSLPYDSVRAGGRDVLRCLILLAVAGCTGCGSDTPTSPTTTTTTTTVTPASPTVTEQFTSTVAVGGAKFYSFTTTTYGTVQLTLTSVGGNFVPATVMVSLGIGQPSGTDCVTTTTINTASGSTPQVSVNLDPGVYCAKVSDIGNLFAPANFTVSVAYP